MSKKNQFITITNEVVYEELQKQGRIQQEILNHSKYTNGKIAENVIKIEQLTKQVMNKADKSVSLGYWIRTNPIKFAASSVTAALVFISESRDIAIKVITNLFT